MKSTERTIMAGLYQDAEEAHRVLWRYGMRIGRHANNMLEKIGFTQGIFLFDIVVRSVAGLGLPKGASLERIYEAALNSGLALCPAETGPNLRELLLDQPLGERLIIATDPILDEGEPFLFGVDHNGSGKWLLCHRGGLKNFWGPDRLFVFVKKPQ